MQLMPATAEHVARGLGIRHSLGMLISDTDHNIRLGSTYVAEMLNRYDGSYVLALAAYNAGPGNVSRWLTAIGDPRDPEVDPMQWIETIPFEETRNYVQRILENIQVYRLRLGEEPRILGLERDMRL